jgi:hypothetical protein
MKIFLSHRSEHKQLVREFKSRLPTFIHTWLDEDALTWGEDFGKTLQSAIQSDVDFVIIFLDADALESVWVKKELHWALAREIELSRTFVLPIVLDNTPPERFPPALAKRLQLVVSVSAGDLVTELARRASEQLFHLVTETLAAHEKTRAFRPTTFGVLQGDWHECHFIYRNREAQLVRERWHISQHEVRSTSDSGLRYSGVIGDDDYTVVARFEGVGHREVVICRLYKPMPSNFTVRGMWFAVDHDHNIACGPEVLTRNKLDDDSARHLLQKSVEMHLELRLMKLLPYGLDASTIDKA